MRAVRLAGQAAYYLLIPPIWAAALLTSANELLRPADGRRLWGGTMPITQHKWPWVPVIIALVLIAWLVARKVGGRRGWLWGGLIAGLRTMLWWSLVALMLWGYVAVRGFATHSLADLIWPFTVGYLLLALLALALSLGLQRRLVRLRTP